MKLRLPKPRQTKTQHRNKLIYFMRYTPQNAEPQWTDLDDSKEPRPIILGITEWNGKNYLVKDNAQFEEWKQATFESEEHYQAWYERQYEIINNRGGVL